MNELFIKRFRYLLEPLFGLEDHLDEFVGEIAKELSKGLKVEAALEHSAAPLFVVMSS